MSFLENQIMRAERLPTGHINGRMAIASAPAWDFIIILLKIIRKFGWMFFWSLLPGVISS